MILHPKNWKPPSGYSNGVAAEGRQVFVAGQVGWNARREIVSDDFVSQVEQALKNIVEILAEAEARPEDLVRLTWYITDKREYLARSSEVGEVYRRVIGRHRIIHPQKIAQSAAFKPFAMKTPLAAGIQQAVDRQSG